ncbi:hypothetical protein ACFX1S_039000 [Malus domestica]
MPLVIAFLILEQCFHRLPNHLFASLIHISSSDDEDDFSSDYVPSGSTLLNHTPLPTRTPCSPLLDHTPLPTLTPEDDPEKDPAEDPEEDPEEDLSWVSDEDGADKDD